jgi:hypothetical protein
MKKTIIKKINKDEEKQTSAIEIIEFDNPVEVSGDGEYLYITEITTDCNRNT